MSSLFGIGGGGNVGASGSFYSYSIDQSLRFNDNDSAYLSRTPASAGNLTTWTWSGWVKRCNLTDGTLFSANYSSNQIIFSSDRLYFEHNDGSNNNYKISTDKLRDTSAWYHLVFVWDTSNATAADRMRMYINSRRVTNFDSSSNPSLNVSSKFNTAIAHEIGHRINPSNFYLDAYLAEVHFVDGQALDPTSFGETSNGVWVPIAYSGSYGTNGWYLSFADSAAIGDDLSGNTNDWTANNLAATDVVPDSPTNNFATFNPLDISGTTLTYSEGNLKAERTTTSFAQAYSSFSFDSGKWYAEFLLDTGNTGVGVIAGTTNPAANRYIGQDTYTYGFHYDGRKVNSASYTAYGSAYTRAADGSGDVVGVYIDADNGDIYFSVNGTVQNSGTAAFTGVTGPFRFAIGSESNAFHIANFGQDDSFAGLKTSGSAAASDDNGNGVFYDAIGLSGYLAPCTANLPEPTIGPNSGVGKQSDDYFNTVVYTGDGTSSNAITGVGFQPDWVWIKQRTDATSHQLFDVIRGVTKGLKTDATDAEYTNTNTLTSFDSDGFTVGTANAVNGSSDSLVSWNWKAGGTAVSNTDGSITSSVSVNDTALFSIGTYTGNGTVGATVGHGLGVAPNFLIIKNRSAAQGWPVKAVPPFAGGTRVQLESTSASTTEAAGTGSLYNATNPSSSVITLGDQAMTNTSGSNYVFYAFANVEGYCKSGSYVGNGSADGTFVYTGHRPSFLLIKETGNANSWEIYDTARDPDNVASQRLFPNTNAAEATTNPSLDILSNGFKARAGNTGINRSGGNYIYLAFAEAPFKYANAR